MDKRNLRDHLIQNDAQQARLRRMFDHLKDQDLLTITEPPNPECEAGLRFLEDEGQKFDASTPNTMETD